MDVSASKFMTEQNNLHNGCPVGNTGCNISPVSSYETERATLSNKSSLTEGANRSFDDFIPEVRKLATSSSGRSEDHTVKPLTSHDPGNESSGSSRDGHARLLTTDEIK